MKGERGFTFIELLVSIAIFAIVAVVSTGTLVVLINANAKAQELAVAMTNLSFAIDSMSRNIRTGRGYYCDTNADRAIASWDEITETNDCANAGLLHAHTDGRDPTIRRAYRYNATDKNIEMQDSSDGPLTQTGWVPITSDQIEITSFEFVSVGSERYAVSNSDINQPQVFIRLEGHVTNRQGNDTDFQVQSNVTQRILDI